MTRIKWEPLEFIDINGHPRLIHGCPLSKLDEFEVRLRWLHEAIASAADNGETTFESAYCNAQYPLVQMLTNEILALCGIKTDWIDTSMARQMLIFFQMEDGSIHEGWLRQHILGRIRQSSTASASQEEPTTLSEYKAHLLSALVSSGLAPDLEKAIALSETLTAPEIEQILDARSEQLTGRKAKPSAYEPRSPVYAPKQSQQQPAQRLAKGTAELVAQLGGDEYAAKLRDRLSRMNTERSFSPEALTPFITKFED